MIDYFSSFAQVSKANEDQSTERGYSADIVPGKIVSDGRNLLSKVSDSSSSSSGDTDGPSEIVHSASRKNRGTANSRGIAPRVPDYAKAAETQRLRREVIGDTGSFKDSTGLLSLTLWKVSNQENICSNFITALLSFSKYVYINKHICSTIL